MSALSHHEITLLFLALGILLATAHVFGFLASRLHQPRVIGELLSGIVLGPTLLGALFPQLEQHLFPVEGARHLVFDGVTKLAIALFLLAAGMEVDLSRAWRNRRSAALVSLGGLLLPFALGFTACMWAPRFFAPSQIVPDHLLAVFVATALSISALPVIARILLDLKLYRSDVGMIVIAGAVLNDLVGWIVFGFILGLMQNQATGIGAVALATGSFVIIMLLPVRMALDRLFGKLKEFESGYPLTLGFIGAFSFLASAVAGAVGIHANFGSFLFGIAVGDSKKLSKEARTTIDNFVTYILAPLFFASVGLYLNFVDFFDWQLTLAVIVLATLSKVAGCYFGARMSGLKKGTSLAIGFGMNARGAVEIVLAVLALQAGLIGRELFVALVIMAMVTSMVSSSLMQWALKSQR